MNMFESLKENIRNNISNYVKTNYSKINKEDMTIGDAYWNRRCHLNAVQYVKQHKADGVYLCVIVDNENFPIVHFINKKDDKYIDNTLGWQYEYADYYIIRKVQEYEFKNIDDILMNTKDMLINLYVGSLKRKIFRIEDCGI